jgi:2-dehydropantoate 2-reductase
MRFVIHGVGAIGGTLAGHLVQSGQSVAGIARGAQLEALRRDGLLLRTPGGDIRASFPVADDPAGLDVGADDVIVLAMKSQDTAAALQRLAAAGVSRQPILCAQNGVDNERMALRLFPNVYAMRVLIPADFVRPGEVAAFGAPTMGLLDLGRYPAGRDATAAAIAAALTRAGFAAFAQEQPMPLKYGKLVSNLANVLDAAGGAAAQSCDLAEAAGAEARTVLAAAGIAAAPADDPRRTRYLNIVEIPGVARTGSSSAQSLARGTGSIETDYLNGEIVLLGRLHGVPTPVNAALVALGRHLVAAAVPPGGMNLDAIRAFVSSHG